MKLFRSLLGFFCALGIPHLQNAFATPLSARAYSPLRLGTLVPGDLAATIPPGTSENAQNASVVVWGEPLSAFTIVLPPGVVNLTTGSGGPAETISLSSFKSFPPEGPNGLLNLIGRQMVFIGATRSAIPPNQRPGCYSGQFDVIITY